MYYAFSALIPRPRRRLHCAVVGLPLNNDFRYYTAHCFPHQSDQLPKLLVQLIEKRKSTFVISKSKNISVEALKKSARLRRFFCRHDIDINLRRSQQLIIKWNTHTNRLRIAKSNFSLQKRVVINRLQMKLTGFLWSLTSFIPRVLAIDFSCCVYPRT